VRFFYLILFTGSLLASAGLYAQDGPAPRRGSRIIDDTTKQIYGPKTSRYFYEEDVFLNKSILHLIDTAPRNFHRYTYLQRNENRYQDLGNIGTAMNPIFYQTPDVIGVSSGNHAYDLLWDTEQIKYYDTKSAYSKMQVLLGGKGRSITRANYSRNINPRWNIGFDYRGLFIDKQIQRRGKGDRNVKSTYYDIYTTYISKDSSRYRLFLNFRRNRVDADEYGGLNSDDSNYQDFFDPNASPRLADAASAELRMNVHLFHQFQVGKALQLYHIFDRSRQGNLFTDAANPSSSNFDYTEYDSAAYDRIKFRTVRNEVGIKGNLLKLFYNGYFALRDYSMTYNYINPDTVEFKPNGTESYLGGRMSLRLDSIGEVTGWVEVLQTGNYRIEGSIRSRWFDATVKQMQYTPSFIQQAYRGSHHVWWPNNPDYPTNFSDINVTQFNGHLHYHSKVFSMSPGFTFTRLGNYVYFRKDDTQLQQKVLPHQTSDGQVIASPELRMSLTMLKHIRLSGYGVYTSLLKNTDNAIQVPALFLNGQLSYENIFFNGNLDMHAGVDVHWRSAYYAQGYDPSMQIFYTQGDVTRATRSSTGVTTTVNTYRLMSPQFPLVDLFINARIKRARIFLKYNNLVQMFTKQGYMPTPRYIGQASILDFGFDWSFYD
jgi:hypothetical protein